MSRTDVVAWGRSYLHAPPPRRRAPLAAALAGIAAAGIGAALWHARSPAPPTRVAIEVACGEPERAACAFAEGLALDVWSEERGAGLPLALVVADDDLPQLDAAGVAWRVLVPDIDAVARAEAERLRSPAALRPGRDFFAEYRDFSAIHDELADLARVAPDRAQLSAIGGSIEGRPLWALHIGRGAADAPRLLINGTQHAREWISTMVTTCVADRLVRDYDRDPRVREFVDHTELWVIPVVNPDGYEYTWGTDRYWRKNRHGKTGVDLNRNFSVAFGGPGSSGIKRSEIYRGEYAFSEPESAALRDLVKRERIGAHIDFHAFSQLVLYPWSYTGTPAPDHARLAAIGDDLASAVFAAHQKRYALMPGAELYPAAGTLTDWMYGEANAVSYTIELRPGRSAGNTGFVLPPEQIRPTCDEGLAAVLALRAGLDAHAP